MSLSLLEERPEQHSLDSLFHSAAVAAGGEVSQTDTAHGYGIKLKSLTKKQKQNKTLIYCLNISVKILFAC